ncbi:endospore germination permease [Paenibacillus sp. R14(2021)]|uniref:GerAB/ArcD/ProY family transporter n=1 Tax=Paenibacillus sp. R14(2021) TaxID=2859228 RepID=UPI001C6127A3|nr:endospore germination permease [Paenibacillus sp. R14(2021)]
MQQSEKITGTQLGLLLFTFIVSTNLLNVPGIMTMFGKRDAWISVFPAALSGLVSIWVMTVLANRYPGLTIIEYSSKIVGKWIGRLIAINYIYYWYVSITTISMQHTGFINTILLPKSPSIVTSLTFLILCGLAAIAGLEVIARCNEFITILILFYLIPILILTLGDVNFNQLKPVLGDGLLPMLQGAVSPGGGYMNQLFILGWLLPYLNQPRKARKVSLIALSGIALLVITVVMLTITVLGPLTGKLTFSFLSVIQYVGIEGSFERLESIAVALWVMGCFVKVAISLFIFSLSISQLFGIRNYREIVFPATFLSVVGTVWIFKNGAELNNYLAFTFPLAAFFNHSLIPLALLMVDTIRRSSVDNLRL